MDKKCRFLTAGTTTLCCFTSGLSHPALLDFAQCIANKVTHGSCCRTLLCSLRLCQRMIVLNVC